MRWTIVRNRLEISTNTSMTYTSKGSFAYTIECSITRNYALEFKCQTEKLKINSNILLLSIISSLSTGYYTFNFNYQYRQHNPTLAVIATLLLLFQNKLHITHIIDFKKFDRKCRNKQNVRNEYIWEDLVDCF